MQLESQKRRKKRMEQKQYFKSYWPNFSKIQTIDLKVLWNQNSRDIKKVTSWHIKMKMTKINDKSSQRRKKKDIFKGATNILIADFSFQQRPWRIGDAGMIFVKCWRENNWKLKIPFKNEDEIKTFYGGQSLGEFDATLKQILP